MEKGKGLEDPLNEVEEERELQRLEEELRSRQVRLAERRKIQK